jgi:hypothetical protein
MRMGLFWWRAREVSDADTKWLELCQHAGRTVQIHVSPDCPGFPDRVELSSGTRLAAPLEVRERADGYSYEDGAYLPAEPWRMPGAAEARQLMTKEPPSDMGRSVSIVKLPDELTDERKAAMSGDDEDAIHVALINPLQKVCELGDPLHWHGLVSGPPNLKTVTVNRALGFYNGLHVDSWEDQNIETLDRAANRICINVGEEDRYFLFLPFSVMELATLLGRELGPEWVPPARYTLIGREFMRCFPQVPVVRCRLRPGEAYIAPTENLVHDGSTLGQKSEDRSITIRGHIRPLS